MPKLGKKGGYAKVSIYINIICISFLLLSKNIFNNIVTALLSQRFKPETV